MRRAVIASLDTASCPDNDRDTVSANPCVGRPGIRFNPSYTEMGLRGHVSGSVGLNLEELIDRRVFRFMGDAIAYAHLAVEQAIKNSGPTPEQISNPCIDLIVGSSGASTLNRMGVVDTLRERGIKRTGPYRVTHIMGSIVSACLAMSLRIEGVNYPISSACATNACCIGQTMEQIQLGKQDTALTGNGEEEHWNQSCLFDVMGALSTQYSETLEKVSCVYDAKCDGLVIVGDDGMVVVEELEHALKRSVKIYTEIVNHDATSDGYDMTAPSDEDVIHCTQQTLVIVDAPVNYLNTHGTSTSIGDVAEIRGVREVFGSKTPAISSTKSLSGHPLGVVGVYGAIYCLLMMEGGLITGSANIDGLDPEVANLSTLYEARENVRLDTVMSNSSGFGGVNVILVPKHWRD